MGFLGRIKKSFCGLGKAIVMFLSVLRHLKIQKPTSQQRRKANKRK
jgi:hypothetical protein